MSRERRVDRYVDALLRNRRPPRFEADDEEARMLRAAATLRGGRPGADLPSPEFVAALESRLRAAAARPDPGAAPIGRRGFLRTAGLAAAAAAAAVGADRLYAERRDSPPDQADLVPADSGWHPVTSVAELTARGAVPFAIGPVQGYVLRTPAGEVRALSAICTHMGCRLEIDVPRSRLTCPCHGAAFTTDGTALNTEYTTPLPRIRTRITGDSVEVLA